MLVVLAQEVSCILFQVLFLSDTVTKLRINTRHRILSDTEIKKNNIWKQGKI